MFEGKSTITYFEKKNSILCEDTFSEGAKLAQKLEVGTSRIFVK